MDTEAVLIWGVVLFLVIVLILIIIFGRTNTRNNTNSNSLPLSQEGDRWIAVVKNLFDEGEAMTINDVYKRIGGGATYEIKPFIKDSDDSDLFQCLSFAISERYHLINYPLNVLNADDYGLNLDSNEVLYLRINSTSVSEEQVIRRDISYAGVRLNKGMLRGGTLSYASNDIKGFKMLDVGRLFITSKRIIFIGEQHNITRAWPLSSILNYHLFKDGVIIRPVNKKAQFINFHPFNDTIIVQDGLFEFTVVLERIIEGNQNMNLTDPRMVFANDGIMVGDQVESINEIASK